MLRDRFEIPKIDVSTLRKYYRSMGVMFRRPEYQYVAKQRQTHDLLRR